MNDADRQLIDLWIDGGLAADDAARVGARIEDDPDALAWLAERSQLHADLRRSLRRRGLQSAALSEAAGRLSPTVQEPSIGHGIFFWCKRAAGWLLVIAGFVLLAVMLAERWATPAHADAREVVRAAIHSHSEAIERVYVVQTERADEETEAVISPCDVRISTQGNRFWVTVNEGHKRWLWGRDADGSVWIAWGFRHAMVITADEIGPGLQQISDLYSLNLDALLRGCLEGFRLEHSQGASGSHVITATRRDGPLRRLTIEIDSETKAVRKLEVERDTRQGRALRIFTLVEARIANESLYRVAGHLRQPSEVLTRDDQPDKRRELLASRFGRHAEDWIIPAREIP
jgi:hypothetical protein